MGSAATYPQVSAPYGVGSGWVDTVLGTTPAAGANFAVACPGEFEQRVLSLTFQLIADANVANRFIRVEYEDGNGKVFHRSGLPGAVTAGTTATFCFSSDLITGVGNANNEVYAPLAPLVLVPPNIVRVAVANIQAGDALSAIVLRVERYLSGTHSSTGHFERMRAAMGET